jgi:integrase
MRSRKRIGLQQVRNLKAGETIWDQAVAGFGARRQRSEVVAYVLLYRTKHGRSRWHTIGRHGAPWSPESARAEAKRLLGQIVDGKDPAADKTTARHAQSVNALCDFYLADAEAGRLLTRHKRAKKTSTLATDRGRIERHIKPLLGRLAVAAVTQSDVERFMNDVAAGKTAARVKTKPRGVAHVRGGKGTASRTTGLLGAIFSYAQRKGIRADNPVHGVMRFAEGKRDRRLAPHEYALLGKAFREAENKNIWRPAINAARFLLLTGWRSGEALHLSPSEVSLDRRTAILADSKTGRSIRPLSEAACAVLQTADWGGKYLFAGTRYERLMAGFPKFWQRIAKLANLSPEVTPHVLRHSLASLASDLGFSESTIAALIGHKGHTITARYVHAADEVLLAAADAVAKEILRLMNGQQSAQEQAGRIETKRQSVSRRAA